MSPRVRWTPWVVAVFTASLLSGCLDASPDSVMSTWLRQMSSGRGDRGWSLLSQANRDTYGDDQGAYIAEVEATDWDAVQWTRISSAIDDRIATVWVQVAGGWDAVPEFMRERPLVQFGCGSGGFVAYVSWRAGSPTIDAGARTGSDVEGRC